jgi:hypothetical protein
VLGVKSRVSSTVTKRKPNPRPRKYASASERQAAYRARAPEVCFRAEEKTAQTLDRIAADLDVSRADLLLSMTKFALTNHDWARFGLTHKPLPFGYGTQDETRKDNPVKMTKRQEVIEFGKRMGFKASAGKGYVYLTNMVGWGETFDDWDKAHAYVLKAYDDHYVHRTPYPWDYKENPAMKAKTTTKRKPTPAQLAARERFAEAARSGAFKKAGASRRKKNPLGETGGRYEIRWPSGDVKASYDSLGDAKDFLDDIDRPVGAFVGVDTKTGKVFHSFAYETKMMREGRRTNPTKPAATRRVNPAAARRGQFVCIAPLEYSGAKYGIDERTPVTMKFSEREMKLAHKCYQLPEAVVMNDDFQNFAYHNKVIYMSVADLRKMLREYA